MSATCAVNHMCVKKVTKIGDWNHCAASRRETYHLSMDTAPIPSCQNCEFRPDRVFCDMPAGSLQAFDEIKVQGSYPRNTILFAEGKPVRGIYLLCDGRAKLSICAEKGKRMTLRVAGPGEVLGLGAALSNTRYEITAELIDASQVVFVRRKDLVKFLREQPRRLHAGSADVEPGPARGLRAGTQHRNDTHAPSAHNRASARRAGLTAGVLPFVARD